MKKISNFVVNIYRFLLLLVLLVFIRLLAWTFIWLSRSLNLRNGWLRLGGRMNACKVVRPGRISSLGNLGIKVSVNY